MEFKFKPYNNVKGNITHITIDIIDNKLILSVPLDVNKEMIEKSKFDYIALGHIHKYSDILKLNNTYYSYPGIPQGQGFDELYEKGIVYGEIDKKSIDLKFKKMCKRMFLYYETDITDLSPNEILNKIIN